MTDRTHYTAADMVLCESPDGWSLHAPGSSDEEIACGDAPYILCGPGEPTAADYAEAFRRWQTADVKMSQYDRASLIRFAKRGLK